MSVINATCATRCVYMYVCIDGLSYLFTAPPIPSRLDKPRSGVSVLPTPRAPPPPIPNDIVEEIDAKSIAPLKDYSWYWGDLSRYVL